MRSLIEQTITITIANKLGGNFRFLLENYELEEEAHRASDWIRRKKLSAKAIKLMCEMYKETNRDA